MANINISFDFSYYNIDNLDTRIVSLLPNQVIGDRLILSVVVSGLTPGTQYTLNFDLDNSQEKIFNPASQTFFASNTVQKLSTICFLVPKRTYIITATITETSADKGASDAITLEYDIVSDEDVENSILNTLAFVEFMNKPIQNMLSIGCDDQIPINANIKNAVIGQKYSYVFESCENDFANGIEILPSTGFVVAGSSTQNISTMINLVGPTNAFCLKVVVTPENQDSFEDYLLIQCKECS